MQHPETRVQLTLVEVKTLQSGVERAIKEGRPIFIRLPDGQQQKCYPTGAFRMVLPTDPVLDP